MQSKLLQALLLKNAPLPFSRVQLKLKLHVQCLRQSFLEQTKFCPETRKTSTSTTAPVSRLWSTMPHSILVRYAQEEPARVLSGHRHHHFACPRASNSCPVRHASISKLQATECCHTVTALPLPVPLSPLPAVYLYV